MHTCVDTYCMYCMYLGVCNYGKCMCLCLSVCQDGRDPFERGLRGEAGGRRALEPLPGCGGAAHSGPHRGQHIHPIHTQGQPGYGDRSIRCGSLAHTHTHTYIHTYILTIHTAYIHTYMPTYIFKHIYTYFIYIHSNKGLPPHNIYTL